jgi:hypothetical protein
MCVCSEGVSRVEGGGEGGGGGPGVNGGSTGVVTTVDLTTGIEVVSGMGGAGVSRLLRLR